MYIRNYYFSFSYFSFSLSFIFSITPHIIFFIINIGLNLEPISHYVNRFIYIGFFSFHGIKVQGGGVHFFTHENSHLIKIYFTPYIYNLV